MNILFASKNRFLHYYHRFAVLYCMVIRYYVPLAPYTTFRVGGPADVFMTAESAGDIGAALEGFFLNSTPYFVLGAGSNVLVPDEGVRGAVLHIGRGFDKIEVSDDIIYAEAGARLSSVAAAACMAELSGLEFAAHIPGTLGGAVFMNAGAFGGDMASVTECVSAYDRDGRGRRGYGNAECGFGYRHSVFKASGAVVTDARLRLKPDSRTAIRERTDEYLKRRKASQPLGTHNAGSIFKAAGGVPAAVYIDKSGLKGYNIGGAEVSQIHANFIVNRGGATAGDIKALIGFVAEKVKSGFGITLQPEIIIL